MSHVRLNRDAVVMCNRGVKFCQFSIRAVR